ncbi:MAG: hypothetical protein EOP49_05580 [Sphingobacteriales bacterium]|nr:MAG: hypothetical protein EOP49_05580 [Sphingobacteriales bacterium]
MQNDKTTLKDLTFLGTGEGSIFSLIDHTVTAAGRAVLRRHIEKPPENYEELITLQQSIRFFAGNPDAWTSIVSNGTLVMLEKFFDVADNTGSLPDGFTLSLGSFLQKLLNRNQYTFTQFSLSHLSDFLKGCAELVKALEHPGIPAGLASVMRELKEEMDNQRLTDAVMSINGKTPYKELVRLSFSARREMKNPVQRMMRKFAVLDAWRSMGLATLANGWVFPEVSPSLPVNMKASGLYHPLIKSPVAYDINLDKDRNFLILTGANMSGKTTFMRTLGVAGLLAHLGMGVPANSYAVSFLQGIITNMHVEDNIMAGESYFFAEVQRIRNTALKIQQPLPHLVLMDELFKGTNVHDAYECTKAVIEGLLNHPRHLMVLSTHLYEVAQQFLSREDIIFNYFVTDLSSEGNYSFSYALREGISDDRIGYRILQKEGVIDLLKGGAV